MLIRSHKPNDLSESDVTPLDLFLHRRQLLRLGVGSIISTSALDGVSHATSTGQKINSTVSSLYNINESKTSFETVSQYNNFYEFSLEKEDVAKRAREFKTRPWTLEVSGEVNKPALYDIDDLLKWYPLEQRIYRFRCVETWSMVVPWVGFPLASLLKDVGPLGNGKYVEFTTLHDPKRMPNQKRNILPWPYLEGLRIDEAMHPLTLLAVGLYDEVLPTQNGAPIRLIVPWKYGFKSIKSIVRIRLVEKEPLNTWQQSSPAEYGFYANVNPNVDHPRWSQARERRLGDFLKRPTLMFNGYTDEVSKLYTGMDLKRLF